MNNVFAGRPDRAVGKEIVCCRIQLGSQVKDVNLFICDDKWVDLKIGEVSSHVDRVKLLDKSGGPTLLGVIEFGQEFVFNVVNRWRCSHRDFQCCGLVLNIANVDAALVAEQNHVLVTDRINANVSLLELEKKCKISITYLVAEKYWD